jgi:hypothetical protein
MGSGKKKNVFFCSLRNFGGNFGVMHTDDVRAYVVVVHVGVLLSLVPAEELQRDAGGAARS